MSEKGIGFMGKLENATHQSGPKPELFPDCIGMGGADEMGSVCGTLVRIVVQDDPFWLLSKHAFRNTIPSIPSNALDYVSQRCH